MGPAHQAACHFAEEMTSVGEEVTAAIGLADAQAALAASAPAAAPVTPPTPPTVPPA